MATEGMILTNHDHQIRVGVLTVQGLRKQNSAPVNSSIRFGDPTKIYIKMGASLSTVLPGSPLAYILKNWDKFDPQTLKKKCLLFFCRQPWPQYKLSNGESWPPEGNHQFLK